MLGVVQGATSGGAEMHNRSRVGALLCEWIQIVGALACDRTAAQSNAFTFHFLHHLHLNGALFRTAIGINQLINGHLGGGQQRARQSTTRRLNQRGKYQQ